MTRLLRGLLLGATFALCTVQMSALRTAAGGNPDGRNGFRSAVNFLDELATYVMWLGVPVGALGLMVGGIMIMVGKQDGSSWVGGAAIGLGIVLSSKAIMS